MSIPKMLSAGGGPAPRHRSVDIVDLGEPLKQDVVQVVLLPGLSKPRRNRLSKAKNLSEKELEVLRWARAGKTVWEISVIRNVSEATVKFHLRNIYHKLGVSNRAHAVGEAVNRGLV
ncbi:LuxR family transcriptional regulator [Pseudomonas gingeri NCPPB 3146 = LMG 5327]|uniref:LuxR family transcriptional regulator n=2 Tax=Pseudomonas gingeri TaxID=117681 RepID=A0A7Y8CBK6_9PSED|nr:MULTISPECIES: LuxR C-terminal-related transcriptional regulator [Pseudomonas]NVZ28097.1 LuxR family transcriptional regulator [Pseudomonas gingeri]NVZ61701.1 LuxR family transcriptional regulator [Pseudomonas gingeri]NVZ75581.1 LuxR family transcriptional regulator [Pseudomonas gingeri]NWA09390.1 LuxR family transcriptional regulator [Pseudomonas gingeri]NWC12042.1 LuxR family transcriptional regulator [Pseudomonas gingeri]